MINFIPSFLSILLIAAVLIVIGVFLDFTLVYVGCGITLGSILTMLVASITERKSND